MPKIQQLSPHVADLIAAGEVVERPASAAKELIENAVDAGAKHVIVEIQNGGMTYLRVTDDGCGMEPEDAETAFLRHATSKLRTAEDLEAIHTLGFRGEALAAISSVSRIDLMTKTADSAFGTSLHLEGGVVTERSETGCPNGTTIIVRDLFYNTPARMKFMKRDTVEAAALLSMVQKLAIAHPDVAIRVIRDGEIQLDSAGDGELFSAIYSVLGRQNAQDMIPVNSHYDQYTLTGFVSKPYATRGKRDNQMFFVNGRFIKSKTLVAALEEAYRNQLLVGRFPSCVLHMHVPEHMLDVNVHPAKTEVKFMNEKSVFECLHYGVLGALNHASGQMQIQFGKEKTTEPEKEAPARETVPVKPVVPNSTGGNARPQSAPKKDFYRTMTAEEYRSFTDTVSAAPKVTPGRPIQDLLSKKQETPAKAPARSEPVKPITVEVGNDFPEDLPAAILPKANDKKKTAEDTKPQEPEQKQQELELPVQDYRIVGEILNTYILVEQQDKILMIDKHAAHERILFEKLKKNNEPIMPQLLLTPILCNPEREKTAVLLEKAELLMSCGYEVDDYGDGTLAIRQIPADIDPADAQNNLEELAEDLLSGKSMDPSSLRDELLHTIACKAAIKGGWVTSQEEIEHIAKEVMTRDDLKYCPHGRPICVFMTRSQVERQFKRA